MSSQSFRLVLDANVWIDSYLGTRPRSRIVRELILFAQEQGMLLLYPIHTAKDIFYVVRAELKRVAHTAKGEVSDADAQAATTIAWACIDNMRENATCIGADGSDLWLACKYRNVHNDLEDNLVLAAAKRAEADMLVTSDQQLITKATLEAHTPEDALAFLKARYE